MEKMKHLKKTAAILTAAVMASGIAAFAVQPQPEAGNSAESVRVASAAPAGLSGPYQNSLNMASANYRNLNMTPGTTVDEMRWTWHSRSATADFALFTDAGGNSPVALTPGANFVIDSRPLGSGTVAVGANLFTAYDTDTWADGLQTRQTGLGGANAVGMTHDYQWFTPESAGIYYIHQVIVTGLSPATDYWYQISGRIPAGQRGAGAFTSVRKPFFTGPDTNGGFTFTAGGDPQIGIFFSNTAATAGVGQKSHVDDYYGWTNAVAEMVRYTNRRFGGEHRPGFFMPVGDLVDTNDNKMRRSQFMYDILIAPSEFHSLPILPVIGNHETTTNGQLFHQHFNLPWRNSGSVVMSSASAPLAEFVSANPNTAGLSRIRPHGAIDGVTPATTNHGITRESAVALRDAGVSPWQFDYYIIYGNMLMLVLDSNSRVWQGGRLEWLNSVVSAYENDVEWIVAAFHHPPYSVFRASNMGEKIPIITQWIPELERLGVDVVLNGHCHVFSRTHQMYQNQPVLMQNWVQPGTNNISRSTTPSSVIYDATGIVYIAFNSMSGSGYRNVRNMGGRNYISAYNQNFRRNFSVVDVTPYSFAVHTYQVNDDGVSVALVDTYTLVRAGELTNALAADPWRLRQICSTTHEPAGSSRPVDITGVEILPAVTSRIPDGTENLVAALGLPTQVQVRLDASNDQRTEDAFGILGARALRDVPNVYSTFVRPIWVDVEWNLSEVEAAIASGNADGVFELTGRLLTRNNVASGLRYQTYPLPRPVADDDRPHEIFPDDINPHVGRIINFQGTPENIMLWRHGNLNANGHTASVTLRLGNAPLEFENGGFAVAELGRTTYHYAHQPFTIGVPFDAQTVIWQREILSGAFNRDVFENWATVRSFTGFGELRGGYHGVPMLETELPPTVPPPGLQIKAVGYSVIGNTPATNHQHTAAGLAFPDAPNVPFHYFSTVFYLPADFDPAKVTDVSGVHIIDDSMLMFINGAEVYRYNTHRIGSNVRIGAPFGLAHGDLLAETTGFDRHIGAHSNARTRTFNINSDFGGRSTGYMLEGNENIIAHDAASRTNLLSALRPGENILTVIVGDSAEDSTAMWFDLGLFIGYRE
ncbi:MAG: metallophosphoesterase [Defluviitaleaceae bacterium]|nr:metallophosphoesterase [Defluviitaleaceae bacterium]